MKNAEEGSPSVISDVLLQRTENLAFRNSPLFCYLKQHLAGQNFHDEDDFKMEVEMWFPQQAVNFYECAIQILVPGLYKCLNNDENYLKK